MNDYTLETFIAQCREETTACPTPADCVDRTAPFMSRLLNGDTSFLKPEHFRSHPERYARNAIYVNENDTMSLYALVWLPGQWTPIHDHGTWGIVGVVEGTLTERNFMRVDTQEQDAVRDIKLVRGGVIMLSPRAVTSFVPNPDHIHVTGNADPEQRAVSLHLYGRTMASFHIYNLESGTREWVQVSHNES